MKLMNELITEIMHISSETVHLLFLYFKLTFSLAMSVRSCGCYHLDNEHAQEYSLLL